MITKKQFKQTSMFRNHCCVTKMLIWQRMSPTSSDKDALGEPEEVVALSIRDSPVSQNFFLSGLKSHTP